MSTPEKIRVDGCVVHIRREPATWDRHPGDPLQFVAADITIRCSDADAVALAGAVELGGEASLVATPKPPQQETPMSEPRKVDAWLTSDGELFHDRQSAEAHERATALEEAADQLAAVLWSGVAGTVNARTNAGGREGPPTHDELRELFLREAKSNAHKRGVKPFADRLAEAAGVYRIEADRHRRRS